MTETLERLAALNIQILPAAEITTHFVFERDGFIALVERRQDGFGSIGSSGVLTEAGFAVLVWKQEEPYFVTRGYEQPANSHQVEGLRRFSADLKAALSV
ncbi:MAG: hypothetical protein ACK5AZ_09970 [Bryobacteraceae bacterium]